MKSDKNDAKNYFSIDIIYSNIYRFNKHSVHLLNYLKHQQSKIKYILNAQWATVSSYHIYND